MLLPATVVSVCESDSISATVSAGDWFGGLDLEAKSRLLWVLPICCLLHVMMGERNRDLRSQECLDFFLAGSVPLYAPDLKLLPFETIVEVPSLLFPLPEGPTMSLLAFVALMAPSSAAMRALKTEEVSRGLLLLFQVASLRCLLRIGM